MGWTTCIGMSKEDLMDRLTNKVGTWRNDVREGYTRECLAYSLVGNNHLWSVWAIRPPEGPEERFIGLDLLGYDKGSAARRMRGGWGYKDLCESMHPYSYDCPLKFLEMAPEANAEWREKVRAHHDRLASEARRKREAWNRLAVGTRLQLSPTYHSLTVQVIGLFPQASKRKARVLTPDGHSYLIAPRHLVGAAFLEV